MRAFARPVTARDAETWRRRPLRVFDVLAGDTLVLWTRAEPLPTTHYENETIVIARALRGGDAVIVRLAAARAPRPRQPGGDAATALARATARRGARVWMHEAPRPHDQYGHVHGGGGHAGPRLAARTLRVERADLGGTLALDELLLRRGLAYAYASCVAGGAAGVAGALSGGALVEATARLHAWEDEARRARLGVWGQGGSGSERPWDYERRVREQGRRSPSPRARYAHALGGQQRYVERAAYVAPLLLMNVVPSALAGIDPADVEDAPRHGRADNDNDDDDALALPHARLDVGSAV